MTSAAVTAQSRSALPVRCRKTASRSGSTTSTLRTTAPAPAAAIEKLRASADAVRAALASLTPERGLGYTLKTSIVGEISVYQIGDWATAHVIRHNAQAKHVLGG